MKNTQVMLNGQPINKSASTEQAIVNAMMVQNPASDTAYNTLTAQGESVARDFVGALSTLNPDDVFSVIVEGEKQAESAVGSLVKKMNITLDRSEWMSTYFGKTEKIRKDAGNLAW